MTDSTWKGTAELAFELASWSPDKLEKLIKASRLKSLLYGCLFQADTAEYSGLAETIELTVHAHDIIRRDLELQKAPEPTGSIVRHL